MRTTARRRTTLIALFVILQITLIRAHFADKNVIENEKHLKHHLEDEIDVNEQWTKEDNRFHYFKLNDKDDDNLISGNEIIAAVLHEQEEQEEEDRQKLKEQHQAMPGSPPPPPFHPKVFTDEELESEADSILKDMDLNGDGYIDYPEYSKKVDL